MEKNKLIAIIAAAIIVIAAVAAAIVLTSGNGNGDKKDVAVTGVTLDKTSLSLQVGGSGTLTATVLPSNATNKDVTWSSGNTAVAGVSGGKVTAVSPGNAVITVKTADGGYTATCSVTVSAVAPSVSTIDDAILKVYGNTNGDMKIDSSDVALINGLIAAKSKVSDANKIADANNDGVIDQKDVDVVNKIIARESTPIWHINYFDEDSNGTMDEVLVETQFPITSVIMTGSSNSFMLMWMLGITEEIKGACYSSTVDTYFKNYYLDTTKVEKIGTSSTTLPFENGKVGTSNIIAEKNVTAVFTDWNKTYITNWKDYENNGIDVVRVSAAAVESDVFAHGALLTGLLFGKSDRAAELVSFYNTAYADISSKLSSVPESGKPGFIASSMTGYISVGDSDYNKVGLMAAGKFGLEGLDVGNTSSIKVVDYPEVYNTTKYNFDYILHLRTGNYYANAVDSDAVWKTCTDAFGDWEKGTEGQYVICGGMPVPVRVAYAAYVMHSDLVSLDYANSLHQQLVDKFFNGDKLDIASMSFIIHKAVSTLDDAVLKVYGNANGDMVIDSEDVKIIQALIAKKEKLTDANKIVDANNDGVIDQKDVDVVNKIIARESTPIWHINYFDEDSDGTMDEVLVETQFPITSVIMTGSSNSFLLMWMLGITEEIKGACYSSSVDTYFNNYYLDTSKVEKIGTSSTTLPFENGKVGTSNIIAEKNVTAVFTDWNKTYITNWQDYENNKIDVVRVSAASVESDVFAHGALLTGLLFGKSDRAVELVNFYNTAYADISSKLSSVSDKPGFIASSMTGYISVGDSDYNKVGLKAGGKFGLEGLDVGNTSSIKVVDFPEVYNTMKYNFDYILHLRTGNYYANAVDADTVWKTCTDAFGDWEKGTEGQYVICGGMPVPLRIAYAASVMHPDLVSLDYANGLHQQLVDKFFNGDKLDIASMNFIIHKA